jgi:hypothetical protein
MSHKDLHAQSQKTAITRVLTSYYTDLIHEQPESFFDVTSESTVINWIQKKNSSNKYDYAFVTINPSSDNFQPFQKAVNKALTKAFISKATYNYEWRSKDVGLHVHILLTLNKPKKRSEIHREFYSTFKNLVGNSRHIHVIMTNNYQNFLKYIEGYKDGNPKPNMIKDQANRIRFIDINHDPLIPMVHTNLKTLDNSPTCKSKVKTS